MTIIQILYSVLFLIFFCFFVTEFFNIVFRGFAPFISTKADIIKKILAEIQIRDGATIMELGCGKAGFLRMARAKYPNAKLIGIEYSLIPFCIAGIQSALSNAKIIMHKKNIFNTNIQEADLIYCYLNPATMIKLEEKFKSECKSGAQVISLAFPMPNLKSTREIIADSGEKIFFYQF